MSPFPSPIFAHLLPSPNPRPVAVTTPLSMSVGHAPVLWLTLSLSFFWPSPSPPLCLKIIMLSEIRQSEKERQIPSDLTYMWTLMNDINWWARLKQRHRHVEREMMSCCSSTYNPLQRYWCGVRCGEGEGCWSRILWFNLSLSVGLRPWAVPSEALLSAPPEQRQEGWMSLDLGYCPSSRWDKALVSLFPCTAALDYGKWPEHMSNMVIFSSTCQEH